IFGGALPWTTIAVGAGIGALIIVVDEVLKRRKASFRVPVLACAVGIYLPLELSVPIFAGGLLAHLVNRARGGAESESSRGTLFAAGLITGEALMGIVIAIPIVTSGSADVLALPGAWQFGDWLGLVLMGLVIWALWRTAVRD